MLLKAASAGLALSLAFIGWEHLQESQPQLGNAISAMIAAISVAYLIKISREMSKNER